MGIYWVYFEKLGMELKIQVDAADSEYAIIEATRLASKNGSGWKVTKAMPCR